VLELRAAKIRDLREQLLIQLSSGTGRVIKRYHYRIFTFL